MIEDIHAATRHSVRRICEVLEVPRSSYYHASEPTDSQLADRALGDEIEAVFKRHRRRYGYRWITHGEARHSFISYHVAAYRSVGDAALQAGNSESIIKRHYLNLHPREEGEQFFRIVPDPARRRAVLAPAPVAAAEPHLKAV